MSNNWLSLFDLRQNANYGNTVTTISEGVSLRGYNLWLLLCSSMLASIGLDTNSAAIIIGAMLISPLMSPILGVGLSIAIHDKQLLWRSSRNLSVAVVISLVTSIAYFLISPLGVPTEELQARTFPTLLDVLVALFGGIAGIVSISRSGPGIALPGVAIATALMPPLCTAGFGIATGDWTYFFGAFYLFFINAVFISMATFLIVKYLHFPERKMRNKAMQRRYSVWFTLLSLVVLLPSIYFLYTLYEKEVVREKINKIVLSNIQSQGNEILRWEMEKIDSVNMVKIYHSGRQLSDSFKAAMDSTLKGNGLPHYRVYTMRINLTKEEVATMSAEVVRQMFTEMQIKEITKEKPADTLDMRQVSREIKVMLPSIDSAKNGWITLPGQNKISDTIPALFYYARRPLPTLQRHQLTAFLKVRLAADTVLIYHQQQ